MKDDNVYYKTDSGKFEPFGLRAHSDYIPDGIWRVRHHRSGRSTTNMDYLAGLYRIADLKEGDFKAYEKITELEDLYDQIIDSQEWKDIMNDKRGWCAADIVRTVISTIYKLSHNKCNE